MDQYKRLRSVRLSRLTIGCYTVPQLIWRSNCDGFPDPIVVSPKLACVEVTYAVFVRPLRIGLIPLTHETLSVWHPCVSQRTRWLYSCGDEAEEFQVLWARRLAAACSHYFDLRLSVTFLHCLPRDPRRGYDAYRDVDVLRRGCLGVEKLLSELPRCTYLQGPG